MRWMKQHIKQMFLVLTLLVIGVGVMAISQVNAYFLDKDTKTNAIGAGNCDIEIVETFDPPDELKPDISFQKQVAVKNTGECSCYVRVKAVFSDSDIGDYATLDFNTSTWKYNEADGYYYYTQAIEPEEISEPLFTTVTLSKDLPEENIQEFDLIIYAECYQANEFDFYVDAWTHYQRNQ